MARLFTPSESKYYLMALDAGTGSIRAVIFDLEGNQIAVGQAEWRHLAVPDVPGSMEFDLNKNWQLACECMRQALHNAGIAPEYIAAVSACSMREGIVLYNNEGAPIWACANVDARAAREVSELKELHNNTFEKRSLSRDRTNTGFKCHPQITLAGAPSFRYLPSGINHHHDQRLAGLYAQRRTGGGSL